MNRNDFKSMSTDELWALHEEIATRLAAALTAEKSVLENRLRQLQRGIETQHATHAAKSSATKSSATKSSTGRRPYPAVVPKYRNPERPSETWAERGKKPRWLAAHLKSGGSTTFGSATQRRQISWPDWLRLSEPAYAMPAPRPAVWRGLRPLHGLASVRLRDLAWFCCALLSPPSWLRLPEVLPAVQMLPYRGGG